MWLRGSNQGFLARRVSILVEGTNQAKVRNLRIPVWGLVIIGFLVAVLMGIAIPSAASSAFMYIRLSLEKARSRNLTTGLSELRSQTDSLYATLTEIERHDIQLRIQDEMPVLPADIRELGIGGAPKLNPEMARLKVIDKKRYTKLQVLSGHVDKLLRKTVYQKESFTEITDKFEKDTKLRDRMPSIVPTHGRFSSRFGMRKHPIFGIMKKHSGVDISNKIGTAVVAPADGVVISVKRMGGYGLAVKIDHGYGIVTLYAHLSKAYVHVGQKVLRYDTIAAIGNSGLTVGPHLHYEVRIGGKAVNPEPYFIDAKEKLLQYPLP